MIDRQKNKHIDPTDIYRYMIDHEKVEYCSHKETDVDSDLDNENKEELTNLAEKSTINILRCPSIISAKSVTSEVINELGNDVETTANTNKKSRFCMPILRVVMLSDAVSLKEFTEPALTSFFNAIGALIAALLIRFTALLIFTGSIQGHPLSKASGKKNETISNADYGGKHAIQAIKNIRTAVSLYQEEHFIQFEDVSVGEEASADADVNEQ
ncbi:unnamed protein product [Adineta steineri]|uniref:Uncharacterized protein n=1 Tax=Adineta steineri TaxID=433720 RepID=A0A816BWT6_9BILA|nr:unnamed protein product [Adineta steineri]CAF1613903.1 unnamed protein product [Adineta steineri]